MTSKLNGLIEVWQKFAASIVNTSSRFFRAKAKMPNRPMLFMTNGRAEGFLNILSKMSLNQTMKGTKKPIIKTLTDKLDRNFQSLKAIHIKVLTK